MKEEGDTSSKRGKKPKKGNDYLGEDSSSKQGWGKKNNGKFKKQHQGAGKDGQSKKMKTQMPAKPNDPSKQQIKLRWVLFYLCSIIVISQLN